MGETSYAEGQYFARMNRCKLVMIIVMLVIRRRLIREMRF